VPIYERTGQTREEGKRRQIRNDSRGEKGERFEGSKSSVVKGKAKGSIGNCQNARTKRVRRAGKD